jgi:hypothetical protein
VYALALRTMRRVVAILAFLLTGWTAVEPVWFAAVPATAPVCCLKNGKHHCAGLIRESPQDGESYLRGALPPCPFRARNVLLARHFAFELPLSTYAQPAFSPLSSIDVAPYHTLNASVLFERGPPAVSFRA